MLSDARLVELFLSAQAIEREIRGAADGALGERTRDALRHATATRKSLEAWIADRQVHAKSA